MAETGCLASDLYVFKTCKNRERKPAKEINGFYPHGTSCGNVMCSKQFFGFTWKTKTTKIVCECNNGRCGWSKPLHKCPTGNKKRLLLVRIEPGGYPALIYQNPFLDSIRLKKSYVISKDRTWYPCLNLSKSLIRSNLIIKKFDKKVCK